MLILISFLVSLLTLDRIMLCLKINLGRREDLKSEGKENDSGANQRHTWVGLFYSIQAATNHYLFQRDIENLLQYDEIYL